MLNLTTATRCCARVMQLLLVQTGWSMSTICGCNLLMLASKREALSGLSFLLSLENWVLHSPLRSWGAEQIASLHFFCRETGMNALFFCSEYYKFQVRESSLCYQISLVQSICLLPECCRALLPSFPQLLPFAPFLAGWESSSTEEQTRRWIWAAQCLQMIFFDEIEKNLKYLMLALLGPLSHSDNQRRKQDIIVTVWQVHEELH